MKTIIHTNLPSPYRVDFFNSLSAFCDLTVVYERKKAKNRNDNWYGKKEKKFREQYLKGILYGDEQSFSFGLFPKISSDVYDVRVLGGYSSLTDIIAIFLLKIFRKRYILDIDGAIAHSDSKIKRKLKSFLIKGAVGYMSTSSITDEYLIRYGADPKRIYRYHFTSLYENELQKSVLTQEEKSVFKEKVGIKEEKAFIAVGSYIHRKGFDILLAASANLPKDVGIYIIGGEPTQEYINLKASLRLDNVHFVQHLTKEELADYYKAADLCVFPTRYDIWGLIVVEALGYGLPVLTTDQCVAGLELIKDGYNGFIVPANDSIALGKKMTEILETGWLCEQINKNVIASIENYTIENMVQEYYEVFTCFIGRDI